MKKGVYSNNCGSLKLCLELGILFFEKNFFFVIMGFGAPTIFAPLMKSLRWGGRGPHGPPCQHATGTHTL